MKRPASQCHVDDGDVYERSNEINCVTSIPDVCAAIRYQGSDVNVTLASMAEVM